MKKAQYITIITAVTALLLILAFGNIKSSRQKKNTAQERPDGKINDKMPTSDLSTDSLLEVSKKGLSPNQILRLDLLEKSITRGDVKKQQLEIYSQLIHFWHDSAQSFIPYAWYTGEWARLENSEKSLTFAGHVFLDQVQQEQDDKLRRWMALQAKDLLERSLKLNPNNDSSKVGIGIAYMFGGISQSPMEAIIKLREVVQRDSTNIYAQMTLITGSFMTGQTEKAQQRLETVLHIQPGNVQAILMLADLFEKKGDKRNAIKWYENALKYVGREDIKTDLGKRINELKK